MKNDDENLNYNITYIPVKNLSVVWRKSQRPYQEAWAKHIADNFDPDKFEPISVTKPNGAGVYHIIEGQHRKGAVELLYGPTEQIPCRVISEADPARAAEIWLGINGGRKRVKPITEFLVAIEAKRDTEVAIHAIIKKHGYHIAEASTENSIRAVGALRRIYSNYGESILSKTLQACKMIWGSDPHGVSAVILQGMAMFLNEFGSHADAARLRKTITDQYKTPWKFEEAASLAKERSSESLDISMSELIRSKYNRGLPEGKKLKHKE